MNRKERMSEILNEAANILNEEAQQRYKKSYKYVLYNSDKRKIKDFNSRSDAVAYADENSFRKQRVEINPNKIGPADTYYIKLVDTDTGKVELTEIYTANIRLRK